ncbi:MAG TPA: fused MFS/spermidine synthase [Firmicutes bacterium]|nr:fused MFS/spermidine synthase [Candidatus Fermentithermobacillaceae bacterium]
MGLSVHIVAFFAGAALMSLEMVGSRILAPFFGSSIYVWGSLIGVVLTALSLGYYAGGYLSDRFPRLSDTSIVFAVAGLWTGLIPLFSERLLPALSSGTPGIIPLLGASTLLFFVPSLLLATISPWCVRLTLSRLDSAGRSAGLLSAVSNIGSIAGTFATSFYLIPAIGTETIIRGLSVLMIAVAAVLLFSGRDKRPGIALVLCVALAASLGPSFFSRRLGGVLYETQSLYHHIYVVEDGSRRLLKFDNSIQSGMYPDRPYESVFPYTDFFHLALAFKEDIRDVLFIGLGAGTVPKRFHRDYPDMTIECVEIDSEVTRVAREYFAFPNDDEISVHTADGRAFLKSSPKTYDLIVVDAYYADSIPFHLTTVEFYELVREKLRPGGILASNLIGALEGERSDLFRSMLLTIRRVFADTYVFPVNYSPGTESALRNIEVFCVKPGEGFSPAPGKERLVEKARMLEHDKVTIKGLSGLASSLYEGEISVEGAVLLTDDYAPVDSLLYLY